MATKRRIAFIALAAAAVVVLAGCVPTEPMPTPTSSGSKSPTPTPTPIPTFDPSGTAEENLLFWRYTVEKLYKNHGLPDGATVVQALVDAGFVKTDMEITPDYTAISEPVDSIIFSVRFNGECLIGQLFSYSWNYTRAPMLGTGTCLVGATRPIDF
jgi:hypothetical protein